MFDDQAFSTQAFDADAWRFVDVVAAVRREVARLRSALARVVSLASKV